MSERYSLGVSACVVEVGGALLSIPREARLEERFLSYKRDRQVVEHRLARLVPLGIRQARRVGRRKTLFQLLMARQEGEVRHHGRSRPGSRHCRELATELKRRPGRGGRRRRIPSDPHEALLQEARPLRRRWSRGAHAPRSPKTLSSPTAMLWGP